MFGSPPVAAAAAAAAAANAATAKRANPIPRTAPPCRRVMGMGTPRTARRIALIAALAAAVAIAAVGSGVAALRPAAMVKTRDIKGLGTVLVNSRGKTLYMFAPDKQKRVTCKGQ